MVESVFKGHVSVHVHLIKSNLQHFKASEGRTKTPTVRGNSLLSKQKMTPSLIAAYEDDIMPGLLR